MTGYPTFAQIREKLPGITAEQMAQQMGMPFSSYRALEYEQNPVRPVHQQAMRYALLRFVCEGKAQLAQLPWDVQETVRALKQV
ncbi:MAG TPA: hypothetical protein VMF90_03085 [Rhizobiaceae bacterium]|nr:hypothetical protein [Rhizobiaceae bacterium]